MQVFSPMGPGEILKTEQLQDFAKLKAFRHRSPGTCGLFQLFFGLWLPIGSEPLAEIELQPGP